MHAGNLAYLAYSTVFFDLTYQTLRKKLRRILRLVRKIDDCALTHWKLSRKNPQLIEREQKFADDRARARKIRRKNPLAHDASFTRTLRSRSDVKKVG